MTKRDMDKSIENGYEYSSPVYTASIFASFLGKPNYGTLEDFGNKVISLSVISGMVTSRIGSQRMKLSVSASMTMPYVCLSLTSTVPSQAH